MRKDRRHLREQQRPVCPVWQTRWDDGHERMHADNESDAVTANADSRMRKLADYIEAMTGEKVPRWPAMLELMRSVEDVDRFLLWRLESGQVRAEASLRSTVQLLLPLFRAIRASGHADAEVVETVLTTWHMQPDENAARVMRAFEDA